MGGSLHEGRYAVIFNVAPERGHGQAEEKKNTLIIDTGATEINSTLFDRA